MILHRKRSFCVFEPPIGGLGATYDDHLRLTEKRVVDFLLVLTELCSLGVTAEALQANIGLKSAVSLQRGRIDPKFQVEGVATPTRRTPLSSLVRAGIPCSTENKIGNGSHES